MVRPPVPTTANNDATYSGNLTVNPNVTLRLAGANGTAGSGIVTNQGTVLLQRTSPSVLAGSVRGGVVDQMQGSDQLTLQGANWFGTLKAQSTNAAKPLILDTGST